MLGFLSKLFPKPKPVLVPPDGWQSYHASPLLPVEVMEDLIQRSPPCLWPQQAVPGHGHWHEWENTQIAHRKAMRRFVTNLEPYPEDEHQGRGIVICAGGWRFFESTFVTVRMIRKWGCKLPIELWYLGSLNEFEPRMEWILRDYGPIVWRDANAVAQEKGLSPRYLGSTADGFPPWEVKAFAVLHSAFREVLSLDADCYPVRAFEFLFDEPKYREHGAVLWPDYGKWELVDSAWEAFGLRKQSKYMREVESGQVLLDKRKCWREISLTNWLCEHRDYTFRVPGVYGDKSLFEIAWHYVAQVFDKRYDIPFARLWPAPSFVAGTFLQHDAKGQTVFQHRTHNKLTLKADTAFRTRIGPTLWDPLLQHEELVQEWMREIDELVLNPSNTFRLRPGTSDSAVWDECVVRNDYRLPERMDGEVIIDLGANIGAFGVAALSRGAAFVYAVEPIVATIPHMQRNLMRWRDRVKCVYRAAWHGRERTIRMSTPASQPGSSSNWTAVGPEYAGSLIAGDTVRTVRFDALLRLAWCKHRKPLTVKIDIEGGEFPVLCTARELSYVGRIYGECHPSKWNGRRWGQDDLREALDREGFTVTFGEPKPDGVSMFWATRELRQANAAS